MSCLPHGQQPVVSRRIRSGELNSYHKLRAFVDGLLDIGSTGEMFAPADVTPEDQEILTRLEKTLEQVTRLVGETVRDKELVALKMMGRANLDLNI